MATERALLMGLALWVLGAAATTCRAQESDAPLPNGVKPVWDLDKAAREKTPTRERVCLNGLWRWQPAKEATDEVPAGKWGFFKVPARFGTPVDKAKVEKRWLDGLYLDTPEEMDDPYRFFRW